MIVNKDFDAFKFYKDRILSMTDSDLNTIMLFPDASKMIPVKIY